MLPFPSAQHVLHYCATTRIQPRVNNPGILYGKIALGALSAKLCLFKSLWVSLFGLSPALVKDLQRNIFFLARTRAIGCL